MYDTSKFHIEETVKPINTRDANFVLSFDYTKPGLETQTAWAVIDSSKLKDYQTCPRWFFFNHVLGWRPESPSKDLVFGEGWHQAMEIIAKSGYSVDAIPEALAAFNAYYRLFFDEMSDDYNFPKSPQIVPLALKKYIEQYRHEDRRVIATEKWGRVSVSAHRYVHYRIDLLSEYQNNKEISDYKTTGQLSDSWYAQWPNSLQFLTYLHAANCLWPNDRPKRLVVEGAVLRKSGVEHVRAFIPNPPERMLSYLDTINALFDRIEDDFLALSKASPDDRTMRAFHKQDTGCVRWFKECPMLGTCLAFPNPLSAPGMPAGYHVDFWDPSERKTVIEESTHAKEEEHA